MPTRISYLNHRRGYLKTAKLVSATEGYSSIREYLCDWTYRVLVRNHGETFHSVGVIVLRGPVTGTVWSNIFFGSSFQGHLSGRNLASDTHFGSCTWGGITFAMIQIYRRRHRQWSGQNVHLGYGLLSVGPLHSISKPLFRRILNF